MRQGDCKDTWRFACLAAVGLAAILPFLPLLGGQFLFDDLGMVLVNPRLQAVHTLADCLHFVFVPSKPVSNLLLALAQWGGGGGVFAQRALSLVAHGAVCLLLFVNLRLLQERTEGVGRLARPLAGSVLFAILPIHSETLAVAIFRQEIVGAFFTLAALAVFQRMLLEGREKKGRLLAVFLFLGMAALSKEVYALIAPFTLLAFQRAGEGRRQDAFLLFAAGFWGAILLLLFSLPPTSYSYRGVIGWNVLGGREHLQLAARAWTEGLLAAVAGRQLTFIPPRGRFGLGWDWGLPTTLGTLLTLALAVLAGARKGGACRALTLSGGFALFLYLVIPNLNIGSQHYWYFPSIALAGLIATAIRRATGRWAAIALSAYAVCLLVRLELRLGPLRTRYSAALAELQAHPETAGNWHAVAGALLESSDPDAAARAEPFLLRAKEMMPGDPRMAILEKLYRARREAH